MGADIPESAVMGGGPLPQRAPGGLRSQLRPGWLQLCLGNSSPANWQRQSSPRPWLCTECTASAGRRCTFSVSPRSGGERGASGTLALATPTRTCRSQGRSPECRLRLGQVLESSRGTAGSEAEAAAEAQGLGEDLAWRCEGRGGTIGCLGNMGNREPIAAIAPTAAPAALSAALQPGAGLEALAGPGPESGAEATSPQVPGCSRASPLAWLAALPGSATRNGLRPRTWLLRGAPGLAATPMRSGSWGRSLMWPRAEVSHLGTGTWLPRQGRRSGRVGGRVWEADHSGSPPRATEARPQLRFRVRGPAPELREQARHRPGRSSAPGPLRSGPCSFPAGGWLGPARPAPADPQPAPTTHCSRGHGSCRFGQPATAISGAGKSHSQGSRDRDLRLPRPALCSPEHGKSCGSQNSALAHSLHYLSQLQRARMAAAHRWHSSGVRRPGLVAGPAPGAAV